jgi:hypothetical protein
MSGGEILMVDILLDQYNDYITLYKMFRDDDFKVKAQNVLFTLTIMA